MAGASPGGASAAGGAAGGEPAVGGAAGAGEYPPVSCATEYLAGESRMRPDEALAEASGLVMGRTSGVLFSHNDSGDSPRLFALSPQGETLGTLPVNGAALTDWEDIAAGFDEAHRPVLYVADIGDNEGTRARVRILRVSEPEAIEDGKPLAAETVSLTYPDGAHNAETLLVDGETEEAVILTKGTPAQIYSVDLRDAWDGQERELKLRGDLGEVAPVDFVPSGGDVSFGGDAIIVRDTFRALLWERAPGQTLWEALAESPCEVPLASEEQGEGIAFDEEGGYFTISESEQPLFYFARVD